MNPQEAYAELKSRMREIALLSSSRAVLGWDYRSHMPPKGADHRGEQLAQLSKLTHQWFTEPRIGELMGEIESSDLVKDPESVTAVNVREWRRQYERETKLPEDFVRDFSLTTSKANRVWAEARKQRDFEMFRPHLEKVIALCRQKADLLGYETEMYDALMEGFEPGARAADVERVFSGLRKDLVELVRKIAEAPKRPDIGVLKRSWDLAKQKQFSEKVAAAIGYDFEAGRLDETVHPFCIGLGPHDVRILSRWSEDDLSEGLTGTVHEAGHALYSLSRPEQPHWGTPMGGTPSLAIHESQSRTWENIVGRSRQFWAHFYPELQKVFPRETEGVSLDAFYGAMNYVTPSYIRVDADEATYNLHIMLRFELERAIIQGEIEAADVPGEWNSRFASYLGIEVDHDANGCLQDTHWSDGGFGYFPTYALGNLYAAQFWAQAQEDLPGLVDDFARGEFGRLLGWLKEKIHEQGFKLYPQEMCKRLTGSGLTHRALIDYLYEKYEGIYGIQR